MTIELRPYQNNQLEFIERKMKSGLGAAIKSPTGSGKSFVILEYARKLIEENKGENLTIVIATGFNNLVYQLEEDSKKFGMNTTVWVGQGHIVSEDKVRDKLNIPDDQDIALSDHQAFSNDYSLRESASGKCVGRKCVKESRTGHKCLYHKAKSSLTARGPKVIITNHTSYLIGLKYSMFVPDIAIIDESHVFGNYYESFNTDSITPDEIKYIQSNLDTSDPTLMLFKKSIENGLLMSPQIFKQVQRKLFNNKKAKASIIARKLMMLSNVKPTVDKYIEVSQRAGIEITNFWSRFDVHQGTIKYLLISATQDQFTLDMFQVPRQNLYVEKDFNSIDYRDSKMLIYKDEEYAVAASKFLARMREEGNVKGLMLSTTNKDIKYLKSEGSLEGYKIFTQKDKFEAYDHGNAVLAGSRALFQGIDIQGLDFVSLNKIPFPSYDKKFKAMMFYLENIAKIDPWRQYTIPKVQNDMTQATGRLWRSPGDSGTIAIFDERLDNKFKYLTRSIDQERPGIKMEVIEDEASLKEQG